MIGISRIYALQTVSSLDQIVILQCLLHVVNKSMEAAHILILHLVVVEALARLFADPTRIDHPH